VALIGQEMTLIDASPDLEFQLEREGIRQIDRIFLTHWHFDHVAGLGALHEPSSIEKWPRIELYLPHQLAYHFDQELSYLKSQFDLFPIAPGDRWEFPDAAWEVVKTDHTDHSVGFVVRARKKFAYLVDGITPPPETLARLQDLDFVILEATMDELDEEWKNLTLEQAMACWERIAAQECILTHLSCHRWKKGQLLAGLSYEERRQYETNHPGLRFAYDGMAILL
jgi:phosphoribosyl 1,2-cyclic phosphate phosphodiesterase